MYEPCNVAKTLTRIRGGQIAVDKAQENRFLPDIISGYRIVAIRNQCRIQNPKPATPDSPLSQLFFDLPTDWFIPVGPSQLALDVCI